MNSRQLIGTKPRSRKSGILGFNLIEAAIVLGVVGLVIGGIWIAAATVNNKMRIDNTLSNIKVILLALDRLFQGKPLPSANADLTQSLLAAGVIPVDMALNNAARHSWGGSLSIETFTISPNMVFLTFNDVPLNVCTELIHKAFGKIDGKRRGENGLYITWIGSVGGISSSDTEMRGDPSARLAYISDSCTYEASVSSTGKFSPQFQYVFPYSP